ncbi:gamma-glutamyltransferase family protein [Luteimonas terricola]|uniref:Gamma-glutamyltransferase n=1 Tax=Luteimonas terricola TaxID=645597 RepID=A0ABQ2EKN1_9GAMM|nr:gamma-glutamyltransferase family protein [Luteimonas terricola]GGK14864.1 gamma-glutamyltransferase [Luteimonas terricola]
MVTFMLHAFLATSRHALLVAALLGLVACGTGARVATPVQQPADIAEARTAGLVSSAHPLATEAGLEVLRRGGSAIDAAVAVQATLGLVEPQSSGLLGGAIVLHYDAKSGRVDSYIGREHAPAGAGPDMFTDADGGALPRAEAMLGGRATGIPGALHALELAHAAHGALDWAALFEPVALRAEQGFALSPRLHRHIAGRFPQASAPDVVALFAGPDGAPLGVGDTFRNPAYASSLRMIATRGADALRTGPLADALAARVADPPHGAHMSATDLRNGGAERTDALCRPLRAWLVCSAPPPASGVGLLQLMLLLDGTDIAQRGPDDPRAWLLLAEASRLMYADRDHYVGDPRFAQVPVDGLLEPRYIAGRRALIGARAAPEAPAPGRPPGARTRDADATDEPAGTSHFVVVDAAGNAVSMTTTIESYFGSGRVVGGMLLNNQLTDFSWGPGAAAANAIAPGKRPRSSMSPVIVLDRDGGFVGAIGSPGGNAIPAYIAKALVGWLYWDLPLQQAVDLPNLVARGGRFNGEADAFAPALRAALSDLGVDIVAGAGEDSGLHGVARADGVLQGAADPRREGVAAQP